MSCKKKSYFYKKIMRVFLSKYGKKKLIGWLNFINSCFESSFNQMTRFFFLQKTNEGFFFSK